MSRRLTPAELADALRDAAKVARSDPGHDLATVLDVLACDHRPDLRSPHILWQLADAVTAFADPVSDGRRPAATARTWCRQRGASLPELLETEAEAIHAHESAQQPA